MTETRRTTAGSLAALRGRVRRDPPPGGVSYRVQVGGLRLFPGVVRGIIAVILVGTLIGAQFSPPASASDSVRQAVQTLAIAVIAFYFGTRTTVRPTTAPPEPPAPGEGDG
jgi:hypothetical protein